MDKWNKNIGACPRGEWNTRDTGKVDKQGAKITKKVFTPYLIWAASECGVVTRSYYSPQTKAFSMFTKDSPPTAWMPDTIPTHPDKLEREDA